MKRIPDKTPITAGVLRSLLSEAGLLAPTLTAPVKTRKFLNSGKAIAAYMQPRLENLEQEEFWVLCLDGRNKLRAEQMVSRGSMTASLVHPREVFRFALIEGAASIVVVHNHPSGDPEPSVEDRRLTARLSRAGRVLGVSVLDHIVVAREGYVSFTDRGWLDAGVYSFGMAAE